MSELATFLIGLIIGFLIMGHTVSRVLDKRLKSGHISDSDYNWYRVEKEEK